MTLVELTIIYLTCGAPFAVYCGMSVATSKQSLRWLIVVATILVWPFYALVLLRARFTPDSITPTSVIDGIRERMETSAFPDNEIQAIFDFRETFYRFVGLANTINEPEIGASSNELFEITGGDARLSARCLSRRNRIRLHRHYLKARREFLSAIAEHGDETLDSLAAELALLLDDPLSPRELHPLSVGTEKPSSSTKPAQFEVAKI